MENKRGLSAAVTSLIIILLVLVAVGIVWMVVSNLVEESASGIDVGMRCLPLSLSVQSVVCADSVCNITIKRNTGGDEIGGVKIIFSNDTDTGEVIPLEGNIEILNTAKESYTDEETGVANANKVEVVPFLKTEDGKESICSQTETFEF